MEILELIKKRCTTRKYKNKKISKKILKKILEAGIWGPAIHHFQPWKYIIVENVVLMNGISNIIAKRIKKLQLPGFLLLPTIKAITNAKSLILVFNNNEFVNFQKKIFRGKIDKKYEEIIKVAEISAISAGIQNMILMAENLGIGSCWLSSPLLCGPEICRLLSISSELVAVLTLGYPLEIGKRSPRKPIDQVLKFV